MNKKRALCICTAVIAVAAAYLTFENEAPVLTEYAFSSQKVTDPLDGFKICHLSDIHVKIAKKSYASLLKKVSVQGPDIIVISGDLVDSRSSDVPSALSLVEKLAAIAPVYYVTGNHEERLPTVLYDGLLDDLDSVGVNLLDGRAETVLYNGEAINIAGLFDSGRFSAASASEMFKADKLNIFINHRPQFAEEYAEAGADLTFSGHAHGGQMRIPFIGGLIAPDQFFFPKYYQGIHFFGDRATVISRGIGNSLCPFRVNNRPEIVTVTLKKPE